MTEQATSLLKIASSIYNKKIKLVGQPIEHEPNEKFEVYHSYPIERCNWTGEYWDIPQYSNGSTRHAKCLFLLPSMAVGDAAYPYLVRDNEDMEAKFKEDERYDREKILIHEYFGENHVEIIWSYDFGAPRSHGQHWYWIDKFWFGIRINGQLWQKAEKIKELIIPEMVAKCPYCGKTKELRFMDIYKNLRTGETIWICKSSKKLYEKCPE